MNEKNFKSQKKKLKILDDGKISYAHRLAELILWKLPFAKSYLQIQCNSCQNSNAILPRVKESKLKIHYKKQRTQDSKNYSKNKTTSSWITIPELKLYYRGIGIKPVWYWYRDKQVDQWNRIKNPEMNPYTYGIFDIEQILSSRKKIAFSTNGASSTGTWHAEKCRLIHSYLLVQNLCPSGSRTST